MITKQEINIAVGSMVDQALTAAGLPAERRKADDPAPIDRRSVQIVMEEMTVDPMGQMRQITQNVVIYFYPEDDQQYRDELWSAANAIEAAMVQPLIVGETALRCGDDGVVIDTTTEVAEIQFSLTWIETMNCDEEYDLIEILEMEEFANGITSRN